MMPIFNTAGPRWGRNRCSRLHRWCPVLLLALWLVSAPPPAPAAEAIRVGIYDNRPLVFQDDDGNARGLFVDVLRAIAHRRNLQIVYVHGAFSDGLADLRRGEIDLMAALAYSEPRARIFDFTYETVITNWGEIYAPKGHGIESILDLEGQRIAVKQGDIHFEALRRLTSEFGINCRFIEGDGYEMVFEMLAADYVPLGAVNHLYGRRHQTPYGLVATPVIFNPTEVKFAALKGRQTDLIAVIDVELARLKRERLSAYHRSLERWMLVGGGEGPVPRWIRYVAYACLLTLVVLACGTLLLRHRIRVRTRELSEANQLLEGEIQVRRVAEEELRKSEKVVAASSDALALLDPQGVFLAVNPAYLRLHGRTRQRVVGHRLSEVYPRAFIEQVLTPQLNRCQEGRTVRFQATWPADAGEIEAELTCSPYFNQENHLSGVVLNIRDVTETQKMAAQLKHAQKMEAIGTLAGGVAHDLNNILSGLVGYPDMLLMDLPPDSPHLKAVTVIKNSGERAAAIVQDMLTLARRGVDQRAPLELNAIIREFVDGPENAHIRKLHPRVTYRVDLSPEPLMLQGSAVHLTKTIMNLVTNAAEAMPEGGQLQIKTGMLARLEGSWAPTTDSKHGYARLEVSDTGTGIAPEDCERIFEPFYTRKVMGRSGTGLGMAVVWGTVTDHDGEIQVDSRQGEGTRFIIHLPLSGDAAPAVAPSPRDIPTGRGETILVVDDETEQRLLASEMLSRLGYAVTTAAGGEAALAQVADRAFDLVILDMIMPGGLDGLDTYQRIRALRPAQKAIIVSGYSESERVKAAQLLGAGTYLRKPYTVERMAGTIYAALHDTSDGPPLT